MLPLSGWERPLRPEATPKTRPGKGACFPSPRRGRGWPAQEAG